MKWAISELFRDFRKWASLPNKSLRCSVSKAALRSSKIRRGHKPFISTVKQAIIDTQQSCFGAMVLSCRFTDKLREDCFRRNDFLAAVKQLFFFFLRNLRQKWQVWDRSVLFFFFLKSFYFIFYSVYVKSSFLKSDVTAACLKASSTIP